MTCGSNECYDESKRMERRIRRLRALADGYREHYIKEDKAWDIGVDVGIKRERARIVAIVRRELKDARRIGVNDFLWLDLLDEIERGE